MKLSKIRQAIDRLIRKHGDIEGYYQTGTFPREPIFVRAPDGSIRIDDGEK